MTYLALRSVPFAILFSCFSSLWAQDTRSTILGRVADPAGAVIEGAQVEVRNSDTGVSSTAATNASGDFLLPFLIPGPYTISVEAPGFKKWTVRRSRRALTIG